MSEDAWTTLAMIGWLWTGFWIGCRYAKAKRAKQMSVGEGMALRLLSDLHQLQRNMRFVGSNPNIVSVTTSEWKSDTLGRFKVTLEPISALTLFRKHKEAGK